MSYRKFLACVENGNKDLDIQRIIPVSFSQPLPRQIGGRQMSSKVALSPTLDRQTDPRVLKEIFLRQEIRHLQESALRLQQWGLTVMIGVSTVIYYVRRDLTAQYVNQGRIAPGGMLPFQRYVIGTVILFVLACLFSRMAYNTSVRLGNYRKQLVEAELVSGIKELPRFVEFRYLSSGIFFIVVILDILI